MKAYDSIKIDLQKFVKKHANYTKTQIVDHFLALDYNKRSLQRWLSCILQKQSLKRKPGSGRPAKIATKRNLGKIKKMVDHKDGCSQKRVAATFGCCHQYVSRILKKRLGVKCYKKIKKPAMTPEQKKRTRPKCRKMAKLYKDEDIIDDESYFTLTHSSLAGNDRFYSSDIQKTPDDVKYKFKSKFEPKLLVWLAISPRGMSRPYFVPSGLAVNQHIYLEQCIQKRLMPFIKNKYPMGRYIFWPDLASSHYANSVVNFQRLGPLKTFGEI